MYAFRSHIYFSNSCNIPTLTPINSEAILVRTNKLLWFNTHTYYIGMYQILEKSERGVIFVLIWPGMSHIYTFYCNSIVTGIKFHRWIWTKKRFYVYNVTKGLTIMIKCQYWKSYIITRSYISLMQVKLDTKSTCNKIYSSICHRKFIWTVNENKSDPKVKVACLYCFLPTCAHYSTLL